MLPMASRWDVCFVFCCFYLSESPTQSITHTWWARSCRILAAFDFSMCLSLSSASQGSTESNATNDEEEMKGRKGTPVFYSLYPVLSFCLPFSEFFYLFIFGLYWLAGVLRYACLSHFWLCLSCVYVCIYCVSGCVLYVCSSGQYGAESGQRHRGDAPTSALTSKLTCQ